MQPRGTTQNIGGRVPIRRHTVRGLASNFQIGLINMGKLIKKANRPIQTALRK